jgi:hypothetical protein
MAQLTAVVTVCPSCGAKIPKAGMSLCPYCASPLQTDSDKDLDRNPIVERLRKMEEKPEFQEALCETPPWTPEYAKARDRQSQGTVLIVLGGLLLGTRFLAGAGGWGTLTLYLGIALALLGASMLVRGTSVRRRLDAQKILQRSAYLVRRRSETALGFGGQVVYFFLIQFGDGSEGEFRYPGRGVSEELYSNGMAGVAFTRGDELLHIARMRL